MIEPDGPATNPQGDERNPPDNNNNGDGGRRRQRDGDVVDVAQPAVVRPRRDRREPDWTLSSDVADVLLDEYGGTLEMKVDDFFTRYSETLNVGHVEGGDQLSSFLRHPLEYVTAGKLEEVKHWGSYKHFKAVNDLYDNEIRTLRRWSITPDGEKQRFPLLTRNTLDDALAAALEARNMYVQSMGGQEIEGAYDSIYNAKWSCVESGHEGFPFGMKVFTGAPVLWEKEEVDVSHTPETMNEPLPRHGNLELAVLTSEKGWPYTNFRLEVEKVKVNKTEYVEFTGDTDLYIRRETLRVWYKVKEDLDMWRDNGRFDCIKPYVLIGTPGIGKSFSAGCFLLHNLLHFDAKELQVVAYVIRGEAYLFHKAKNGLPGRVVWYKDYGTASTVLWRITTTEKEIITGFVIFDVDKNNHAPSRPPVGCSGIALSYPDERQYFEWAKQNSARRIYINCDTLTDLMAMHVWRCCRIIPADQWTDATGRSKFETLWGSLSRRVKHLGPLTRYAFNEERYLEWRKEVDKALMKLGGECLDKYIDLINGTRGYEDNKASHKLVRLMRVQKTFVGVLVETHEYRPLSDYIFNKILDKLTPLLLNDHILDAGLMSDRMIIAQNFEKTGLLTLLHPKALIELKKGLRRLSVFREHDRGSVLMRLIQPRLYSGAVVLDGPLANAGASDKTIEFMRLYRSDEFDIPVIDVFFFVEHPKTFVGLQYAAPSKHPCSTLGLFELKGMLQSWFCEWDTFSVGLDWEVIYVLRCGDQDMDVPQCCIEEGSAAGLNHEGEVAFWDEVSQFSSFWGEELMALCMAMTGNQGIE